MANGKITLGKQSGGTLGLVFPDGVSNTEVVLPESGELIGSVGNQTISDIKTFLESPIVPTPTANTQAVNKAYVDSRFTNFDDKIKLITRSDTQAIADSFIVMVTSDEEIKVRGRNIHFLNGAAAANNGFITINNPNKASKIKEIVVAYRSVYILYENGNLYAMGANNLGQLGIGNTADQYQLVLSATGVKKIATSSAGHHANYNFSFIIKTDNTIWATGHNAYGQLGLGDAVDRNKWTQVVTTVGTVGEIKDIFCCDSHVGSAYILTANGQLLSTGYNGYGNLGLNDVVNRNTFQIITALNGKKITKFVYTSGYHTEGGNYSKNCLALSETGELYAWGYNAYGQLGTGDVAQKNSPVLVNVSLAEGEVVSELYAPTHGNNFYIKTNNNRLFGTGYNGYGQLNQNNTTNSNVFIKMFDNVKSIHVTSCLYYGYYIGLYIFTNNNKIYVCGYNAQGALGRNKTANILKAEEVIFEHAAKIKQITSGGESGVTVYILQDDGKLFACGYNNYGQISMPAYSTANRLTRIS